MHVLGLQIINPDKPTYPFYTMVVTERGVLTHYGSGNRTNTYTPQSTEGRLLNKDFKAHSTVTDFFLYFTEMFDKKRADYTVQAMPTAYADLPIPSNSSPEEILRHFYTSPEMRSQDARRGNPGSRFLTHTAQTSPANRTSTPVAPPAPAPVKAPTGLTVTGKITRPNGEAYLPRWIGEHHDVALLRHLYKSNIFARVFGAPGTGKTALIEAAFPTCLSINGHGDMTIAHLVGSLLPKPDGGWNWVDGPLVVAMKEGRKLLIDEITRIPTEVLSVIYSTMDGRNILRIDDRPDLEPVTAKKGFGIIAGYNPDTLGARALDEALISRFKVGIEVTTDLNAARALKVPPKAITLTKNLEKRNKEDLDQGGPGIWVPQMRELLTYRDLIKAKVGEEFAVSALIASCPHIDNIPDVAEVAALVFGYRASIPTLGASV